MGSLSSSVAWMPLRIPAQLPTLQRNFGLGLDVRDQGAATVSIEDLSRGDERAWTAFFADYEPLIRSVIGWSKWRFKPQDQDDLLQEVRTALPKSVSRFRGESRLDYFVKRVCINVCVSRIRRLTRERSLFTSLVVTDADGEYREMDVPAGEAFDPVRTVLQREAAQSVRQMMTELDATCQTAIRLFYVDELSYAEIAGRLGIAVNTVGSRLAKCLEKLRRRADHDPLLKEYRAGGRRHED